MGNVFSERAPYKLASLQAGRAYIDEAGSLQFRPRPPYRPVDKLRRAYEWITHNRIVCPYYDIQFGSTNIPGTSEFRVDLTHGEAYASFILLPLLTLISSGRMLIVGGVGRGKTSLANLMGMLVGYSHDELRKTVQHGHPQLTVADLLGSPLPADLVRAEELRDVHVFWRSWIQMRVKIIDEYNRIPTKTQSALLSLLSEGYAEAFEQVVHAGESAWYLTANDEIGGGTFPVIDALKDRIDVVSRSTPIHASLLQKLEEQIEVGGGGEGIFPADIVMTPEELNEIKSEMDAIKIDEEAVDLAGRFLAQLDFCRQASQRLDYMSKDTIRLTGRRLGQVCNEDCPLDKRDNVCTQAESGPSARVFQSIVRYAKALAFFRMQRHVTLADLKIVMPWVLNEKIRPNPSSAFFQSGGNSRYLLDQVSWISQMFELFLQQYSRYNAARGPLVLLQRRFEEAPARMSLPERTALRDRIYDVMSDLTANNELNAFVHNDLISLRHLHHTLTPDPLGDHRQ